jgi:hypothetical protein
MEDQTIEIIGFDNEEDYLKAVQDHQKIMDDVNKIFSNHPKDDFGNLIITEEISNYILTKKGK